MSLKDNAKFKEANKLIKKADELVKQSRDCISSAQNSMQQFYDEVALPILEENANLAKKRTQLETKYVKLLQDFCVKSQNHTCVYREFRLSNRPRYHSFARGDVYPMGRYSTCIVCGWSNDPEQLKSKKSTDEIIREAIQTRHSSKENKPLTDNRPIEHKEKAKQVISEAAQQDKNKNTQKIAERLLEIEEEITAIDNTLKSNYQIAEEICELFGHNAVMINDAEDFECKCCGKKMPYHQYISAHHNAKFGKLGIVPFYY